MYGICTIALIPCRAEPSSKSEMVTQLLFGEYYKIIEKKREWLRIETAYDNYNCWISRNTHFEIDEKTFAELSKNSGMYCTADLVNIVQNKKNNDIISVLLGSSLPNYRNTNFYFGDQKFIYEGDVSDGNNPNRRNAILQSAFLYLNAPYLWGGRSPFGIDCSGLTQMVFKLCGIKLKRDASQQAEKGTSLSFIEESLPGDLAFFDNEEGQIVHVGIILENFKIIHASGKVRIDKLDSHGIFNNETGKHSHRLRIMKKIID